MHIRNDRAVSVFLAAAYPDRKGAENILKHERKSDKPYDVCFYADAGLREISAKEGNRQAQAMTVYLKGNPAGYDWQDVYKRQVLFSAMKLQAVVIIKMTMPMIRAEKKVI